VHNTDGTTDLYEFNTTDEQELIDEIVDITGLSIDEVEEAFEFVDDIDDH